MVYNNDWPRSSGVADCRSFNISLVTSRPLYPSAARITFFHFVNIDGLICGGSSPQAGLFFHLFFSIVVRGKIVHRTQYFPACINHGIYFDFLLCIASHIYSPG